MEPNYFWANLFLGVVPFVAYYCGIFIRKIAMPPRGRTSLAHQCLLGIPISLLIVSPFLPILNATVSSVPGYLLTIGIIMEHGMLVNETATYHIRKRLDELRADSRETPQ
jgi:hypothetical protein